MTSSSLPSWRERPEFLLPILPVLGFFAPRALWIPPAVMVLWWVVLALRGVLSPALTAALKPTSIWRTNPWLWLFILWSTLSVLWGPEDTPSWGRALALFYEGFCAAALISAARILPPERWIGPVCLLLAGAILVGGIATLDGAILGGKLIAHFRMTGLSPEELRLRSFIGYNRGGIVLALVALPAAVLAWRMGWKRLGLTAFAASAVIIAVNYSGTARGAFILSLLCAGAVLIVPVLSRLVAPLMVAAVLLMPFALPSARQDWFYCPAAHLGGSVAHRVSIWTFTQDKIMEKPLVGWGLEAERTLPGGKDKTPLRLCDPANGHTTIEGLENLPLHPHNASLQVWLDGGAVGAFLAALALGFALHHGLRQAPSRQDKALLTATAVAAFLVFNFSYGVWQSWLIGVTLVALALTLAALRAGQHT